MSDYDYASQPMTPERHEQIVVLADSLRRDAAHDIEDKRDIYEALIDLLNVARIEHHEE